MPWCDKCGDQINMLGFGAHVDSPQCRARVAEREKHLSRSKSLPCAYSRPHGDCDRHPLENAAREEGVQIPIRIVENFSNAVKLTTLEEENKALRDRLTEAQRTIGAIRSDNMLMREYINILRNFQPVICQHRVKLGPRHVLRISLYEFEMAPFRKTEMVVVDKFFVPLLRHFMQFYTWAQFKHMVLDPTSAVESNL